MLEFNKQSKGKPEWGYALDFSPRSGEATHEFCGENKIGGAVCPYCNKPLLRLLSLNATDSVLEIDKEKTPAVHLLYCWTCSIPYGEFSYVVNRDGTVTFVNVPPVYKDALGPDGPYDDYTGIFAGHQVALRPIPERVQQILLEWHSSDSGHSNGADDYLTHQIGGYPFINNPSKGFCPVCQREMPLLAAICDNAAGNNYNKNTNETFTGNCGVQMVFLFCRECSLVTAYHSVD
jgi:hypothetical protein